MNDAISMELFTVLPDARKRQLDKFTQVHLYLRVITLADLTHKSRAYIPDRMLTGKWQVGSDLE